MSLCSYIGCNVELPLHDYDSESEDIIKIGWGFSDQEERVNVQKYQFTTPYVYDISNDWGIVISEEWATKEVCEESKVKLTELCKIMNNYLEEGDFFELYSCWIGEEADKRYGELTIQLNNFDINQIEIGEKTLVRFVK
ncbi:hypothetical protein [Peribacillus frigoritolerans]|uniref:hypothetical protein n=1 Tax=Peribacillus frigoritolerans TaxID=450367 RepID=UPI0020793266|nr:hypothetical protein [Peribacillus frigoritolerans]USK76666.1 hypothetical protein LIT31_09030 [Peribacillus frigoritolerans]